MLGKVQMNIHASLPVFSGLETARQAAQIKMMRKLEKRALAQAAKEAKRQKGKAIIHCTAWMHFVLTGLLSIHFKNLCIYTVCLLIKPVWGC